MVLIGSCIEYSNYHAKITIYVRRFDAWEPAIYGPYKGHMAHDIAVKCWPFNTLATLTFDCATAQCIKTVRWSDDPPYAFKSVEGSVIGINSDIAREAQSAMITPMNGQHGFNKNAPGVD